MITRIITFKRLITFYRMSLVYTYAFLINMDAWRLHIYMSLLDQKSCHLFRVHVNPLWHGINKGRPWWFIMTIYTFHQMDTPKEVSLLEIYYTTLCYQINEIALEQWTAIVWSSVGCGQVNDHSPRWYRNPGYAKKMRTTNNEICTLYNLGVLISMLHGDYHC